MNKIDDLHELLEEGGYHSSSSSNTHQLVLLILSEEVKKVKQKISGRRASMMALHTWLKHLCDKWELKQKIVSFHLLSKSLTGEVARLIAESISTELRMTTRWLLQCMTEHQLTL